MFLSTSVRFIFAFFPISISSDTFSGSRRKEGAVPKLSVVCIYSSMMGW